MVELTSQNNSDYVLCGYRGNKPAFAGLFPRMILVQTT